MINPHGGILVDKLLSAKKSTEICKNLSNYPRVVIDSEKIKEVKNIARGVYSPIEGFLKRKDFESVVSNMRLASGVVFPMPIVLDISKEKVKEIENQGEVLLVDVDDNPVAVLSDIEIYPYDKKIFASNVYGTLDKEHPGVEEVLGMKDYLLGGEIGLLSHKENLFPEYNFTPQETRKNFQMRGWNRVVAFQTRNVPHRGHEFLQKEALKKVDGLFVQPVIGKKKLEDFKDEYIISSYEILINKHYPKNKVILGILPLKMRYAGPREAVFHAIIRKNYGCSHFIVGRDHAGVGDYYEPFAAQEIFDKFKKDEIGVEILKFPEVVYDSSKKKHCFIEECSDKDKISFSGTKLREKIKNKKTPPEYLIRQEVFNVLTNSKNSLVDETYKEENNKNKQGYVLWFTGLSQSGKSTVADAVYEYLNVEGYKTERLDGDIVRESLTRDLGFSKEDRDENIRRTSFVAKLLSRNGVGVIASFISPYKRHRDDLRVKVENFIEIFVDTPLEVCEKRDKKGLYKKARLGKIKNFTGISDPYEEPENPEVTLYPAQKNVKECRDEIIKYLEDNNLI